MSEQKKEPWTIAQWIYYGVVAAVIGVVFSAIGQGDDNDLFAALSVVAFIASAGMLLVGIIGKANQVGGRK